MIDLRIIEEIMAAQLQVTQLVAAYERSETDFPQQVKEWLSLMEQMLTASRVPFATELAVLRGNVVSAERGVIPPDVIVRGQPSPRKVCGIVAFNSLRKGEEIVRNAVRPMAIQVGEGEDILRQLVALARQSGILPGDEQVPADEAWRRISGSPELRNAAAVAMSTLGPVNVLLLLQRRLLRD